MHVIFYHQPSCGMCKTIELMLNKKGIEYDSCMDVDVMLEKDIPGTPALDVDGKLYVKKECLDWIRGQ